MQALTSVLPELASVHLHILMRVETDGAYPSSPRRLLLIDPNSAVYSSHLRRQEADLKVFMEDESLALDPQLNYESVEGLSSEVRERLARVRPTSIVSAVEDSSLFQQAN